MTLPFYYFALVVISVFNTYVCDEEKYTTKYDNINFEEIIASDRLLKNYVNCLMGRGSCTPDANELKRVLPEALETDCKKCSEAQKTGIGKVVKYLIRNRRPWWDELEAKYDPNQVYWDKYKADWEAEGITLH
ncbi:ejaculatory bulb-specific protein 3-like [Anthonomus grandis grandis]|uniref:ejaculatory bulb-specific protein 3-like n=1 Tax=Anthonomus grandis grandis TaxID=2921223 RepID=UPI0021667848|nr:ejaculatory bulb-specific protein 3-like [Anthonomus grandis grandis]